MPSEPVRWYRFVVVTSAMMTVVFSIHSLLHEDGCGRHLGWTFVVAVQVIVVAVSCPISSRR